MGKERYKGVEYFDGPDLAKGYMLEKAKDIYEGLEDNHIINNINEALELYTMDKYVKDGLFLQYLGVDKEEWLQRKNKIANASVGKYVGSHQDILAEYNDVDFRYKEIYWGIVGERKLSSINENELVQVLNEQEHFVWQIFKHKKVVDYFDNVLRSYMLDNLEGSTNMVLDKYLINHLREKEKFNLPASLTLADKEKIISDYLDIERPNLNYTRLLSNVQNTAEFTLNARTKLKAKRVSESLESELFKGETKRGTEIVVEFKENVEGTVKHHFTLKKVGTEVEKSWLEENIDYPTILNNFIYIFDFVDKNMVSDFIYKEMYAGIFERFGFSHNKEYKTSQVFHLRESLSLFQIHVYYSFLKNKNINLEDVIEWFFNEYLKEEFGIEGFNVKLPPTGNPSFEKCKSIFPTIESIIKKYRFYIEDGVIDEELVEMESKPLPFSECPSKTNNRYAYLHKDNEEAIIVRNIMFSDQSDMTYFPNYGDKQYDTLIDRLDRDKLYRKDIEDYQEHSLEWLIENGFVKQADDGELLLVNRNRTIIYYRIYTDGVIVPIKLPEVLQKEIEKLITEDKLVTEKTLLTRQESDYIDYYLNKSIFINGHDLRNKYLHGTSASYDNENTHYTNYLHALRLLITIMIKINDDLCTTGD